MKRKMIFGLLFITSILFTGCDKDDDAPILGANVKVKVSNWAAINKDGVTVYMFDKEVGASTDKNNAKSQKVTNADGVVEFDLNFTKFNILENETTLYFAVFYTIGDEDFVADTKGITVKRNNSYNLDITIPL